MPRSKKQIHYIYKTTCNVTNRYYIGMHSTSIIDDGYLGSGTILRHSIRKHGKENHICEILEYCMDRESLALREQAIVTSDLITDPLCMNLKPGGIGGWGLIGNTDLSAATIKLKWLWKNDPVWRAERIAILSKIWTGKTHTAEAKLKMSLSKLDTSIGEKNSQYGRCWITNGTLNKTIKCEELHDFIAQGWVKGRKMNFVSYSFSEKGRQKATIASSIKAAKIRDGYHKDPNLCNQCPTPLEFYKRRNKFCSKSCAATYNNRLRGPRSDETKSKISKSLMGKSLG